jgi:hypothetical protein
MFFMTVQQSWLVGPLELGIPVAFAAGALFKVDSRLPSVGGRWFAATAALIMVASIAGFALASGQAASGLGDWGGTSYTDDSIGWNRVAPHWPDNGMPFSINSGVSAPLAIQVDQAPELASFRDLRLEAWRAKPYPGAPSGVMLGLLDTGYTAPFETAPAVIQASAVIAGRLDLTHSRASLWWIFLTGIAPDGQRYWLGSRPGFVQTQFSGTIWDWLTASN